MNTLSNHGFVPHNGRNITKDILIKALNDALNVPEAQALDVFETALVTNPTPNATVSLDSFAYHRQTASCSWLEVLWANLGMESSLTCKCYMPTTSSSMMVVFLVKMPSSTPRTRST